MCSETHPLCWDWLRQQYIVLLASLTSPPLVPLLIFTCGAAQLKVLSEI